MADHIAFLCCLEFALLNSLYQEIILKPKQVICLESVYLEKDVMCVLPTGYGKSLVFHLLPMLLFAKFKLRGDLLHAWRSKSFSTLAVNSIVIVVSPLNSLISDQISRLQRSGLRASIVNVCKEPKPEFVSDEEMDDTADDIDSDTNVKIDFGLCEERKLRAGHYQIIFAHPEAVVSSKYGRELLLSKAYQENVSAVVVDEAHCIVEWGSDFRKDYGRLGVLCALFPDVPCLAMTATASQTDMQAIKDSLGLKNCRYIVANPDRKNIFYKKVFRHGQDIDAIESILIPIAKCLLKETIEYPLTIVYVPLKLCGFAYKLFEHILGVGQYFPLGSGPNPENRLFGQFHASQTPQMKEEILKQLSSKASTIRVVFATVAIGMGVDIPNIHQVIHIGPPCTVKAYFQETGRAGRDGKKASACLYYNNRDIGVNRAGMQNDMREFCLDKDTCLRKLLLKSLDYEQTVLVKPLHLCCSVCQRQCGCCMCLDELLEKLSVFIKFQQEYMKA